MDYDKSLDSSAKSPTDSDLKISVDTQFNQSDPSDVLEFDFHLCGPSGQLQFDSAADDSFEDYEIQERVIENLNICQPIESDFIDDFNNDPERAKDRFFELIKKELQNYDQSQVYNVVVLFTRRFQIILHWLRGFLRPQQVDELKNHFLETAFQYSSKETRPLISKLIKQESDNFEIPIIPRKYFHIDRPLISLVDSVVDCERLKDIFNLKSLHNCDVAGCEDVLFFDLSTNQFRSNLRMDRQMERLLGYDMESLHAVGNSFAKSSLEIEVENPANFPGAGFFSERTWETIILQVIRFLVEDKREHAFIVEILHPGKPTVRAFAFFCYSDLSREKSAVILAAYFRPLTSTYSPFEGIGNSFDPAVFTG